MRLLSKRLSPLIADHALAAYRYAVAALVFGETFLAAKVLRVEDFGRYSYAMQMAQFFGFTAIGGASGFIYHFYNVKDSVRYRSYLRMTLVQVFLFTSIIALVFYLMRFDRLWAALALFIFWIPYLILEPVLRVHNRFFLAVSFRLAIAIAPAIWLGYLLLFRGAPSPDASALLKFTGISWALGSTVFAIASVWALRRSGVALGVRCLGEWKSDLKFYWEEIFRFGLAPSANTIFFFVFTYVDRIIIDASYPQRELGIYSLASQVCAGVSLYFTTRNYIFSVKVGEVYKSTAPREEVISFVAKQYQELLRIGLVAYLVLVAGGGVLSKIYPNYEGLTSLIAIMGVGILASNIGSVGIPILHYSGRMRGVVLTYVGLLFGGVAINSLLAYSKVSFLGLVASTSALLTIHALLLRHLVDRILSDTGYSRSSTILHSHRHCEPTAGG